MPDSISEGSASRLLIIDDDVELCELVSEYLTSEGFLVETVYEPEKGITRAVSGDHVLIVLDVMLPRMNGFEVLRRIRARSSVPVLMLTARGEEVDRIVGLEIGADDYLPKPFNPRELIARIKAVLRRTQLPVPGNTGVAPKIVVGDIELDSGARTVRRRGELVELTGVEFNLLETLLQSAGRIVERDDLSRTVLGRRLLPYDRSIDMHVSNLRKKLGRADADQERIKAIRGLGYIYTRPEDSQDADPPDHQD